MISKIFVICGTQKFQFDRLISALDRQIEEGLVKASVFGQIGGGSYEPTHFPYARFMDDADFKDEIRKADLIVTHSGTGSIVNSLKSGKKVIVVPRLAKYGEHVNDHQLENGLVLACGVKGCGKSTTIAAILQEINTARRCHILTIEDPIEYLFRHDKSIVDQREVGLDCGSYAAGIRAAAREDPDVIFVGELRDKETIDATLSAAETGHLVFSTIHCTGLSDMTGRILHAFDGSEQPRVREQLMSVLKGVVAPGLIRYADGNITPVFSVLGEKETEKLF